MILIIVVENQILLCTGVPPTRNFGLAASAHTVDDTIVMEVEPVVGKEGGIGRAKTHVNDPNVF